MVAAVVVVVVAAVVAAAAGGKAIMKRRTNMNAKTLELIGANFFYALGVATLVCLVVSIPQPANAQTATTVAVRTKTFTTAQQAADALIDAAEKYDVTTLEEIFGPDGNEIIHTGEPARDQEVAKKFAEQARAKLNVAVDPKTKRRAFLSVGNDDWPFPVPIVKVGTHWSFDAKAGLRELLYRRIGANELDSIEILRGIVEAQNEYALAKHGDATVNQYAQRIISSEGKQDGLAWQNADGTWGGPIGENVARAIERGYTAGPQAFHGYYFAVLKGQGPAAPLGQLDYVVKGAMIGGFALIATPAQYRVTGVKTFIVSQDGVVYEKDLGPNTLQIAKGIDRFNPDGTWIPVLEDK